MDMFCRKEYTEGEIREMPVLALAHIGDGVYELLSRMRALNVGAAQVNTLHKRTISMVSAEAQAKAAKYIKESSPFIENQSKSTKNHAKNNCI